MIDSTRLTVAGHILAWAFSLASVSVLCRCRDSIRRALHVVILCSSCVGFWQSSAVVVVVCESPNAGNVCRSCFRSARVQSLLEQYELRSAVPVLIAKNGRVKRGSWSCLGQRHHV
eukprot:975158-Rhodomonas_salina.3